MIRVLVNMPSQYGGEKSGVAEVGFQILRQLLKDDDIEFWLRSNWSIDQIPKWLMHQRLHLIYVDRPRRVALNLLTQQFAVAKLCKQLNIHVIWNVDPFGATVGAKVMTTVHDVYFKTNPELFSLRSRLSMAFYYWFAIKRSHTIVTISKATNETVSKNYRTNAKDIVIILNGAGGEILHSHVTQSKVLVKRYFLIVGKNTPNKNFAVVVEALTELRKEFPDAQLLHVGEDSTGTIDASIKRLTNAPELTRKTGISSAELADVYKNALCLIVSSISEGFCLPIIEAQSYGCPVVTSNLSAMPEIAGDGALYFDPYNSNDLKEQLTYLLSDEDVKRNIVDAGYKNAGRYSWERSAQQYAALIKRLALSF